MCDLLLGNLSTRHFWGDGDVYKRASLGKREPSFPPKSKLKQRGIFSTATLLKPASKAWKKPLWKMSFRETREMLLLAYDGKIIYDEEFLVLWKSCRSTTLILRRVRMQNFMFGKVRSLKTRHPSAGKRSSTTNEHPLSTKNNLWENWRFMHATQKVFLSLPLFRYDKPLWKTSSRVYTWLRANSWTTF